LKAVEESAGWGFDITERKLRRPFGETHAFEGHAMNMLRPAQANPACRSNSIGLKYPIVECRRFGLYNEV
jgi:hypothetical protein